MSSRDVAGIKLVAIDLDGTLLNDSKEVAEHTVAALKGLPRRGVRVVIASARPPRSVKRFHDLLGLDTLSIHYNGAMVWDWVGRGAAFHRPLDRGLVRKMAEFARDAFPEVLVSTECSDRWFTDRLDERYTTETAKLFAPDRICPLNEFVDQETTKLLLLGEPAQLSRLRDLLRERFAARATILHCGPDLLEITDRSASKGRALRFVAEWYGVEMERVMAIGDAANDVPMLEAAGIGIAMDNANPETKAVANWVAPSNNDHGVHAALLRYGLCE